MGQSQRDQRGVERKAGVVLDSSPAASEARAKNANNPYHRAAGFYELSLSLPVISFIRRQEARAVADLVSTYANPQGRALEIGPGTGFYTIELARQFREVVAVEDSATMAGLLREKLYGAGVSNVAIANCDFMSRPVEGRFDVAVAIGVLDYVSDPAAFVARMCAAADRAVIFTTPHRGLWGKCFVAANRLRGTSVYCHDCLSPNRWAPEWRCVVHEVGLKTPLTKGMTLVAALERP
jgi:SAM-dependent methyltransferase